MPLLYGKPDEEHRLSGGGVARRLRRYVITIEGDKNVQRKSLKAEEIYFRRGNQRDSRITQRQTKII